MGRKRAKAKGRREGGAFIPIPVSVLHSENWKKLSSKATRLLMDTLVQLQMRDGGSVNNGDLVITRSLMRNRGWTSAESLYLARDELLHYGFIIVTRPGGRNQPTLYAITFFAIDECNGKHDLQPTRVPGNDWKTTRPVWQRPIKKLKPLSRFINNIVPISGIRP